MPLGLPCLLLPRVCCWPSLATGSCGNQQQATTQQRWASRLCIQTRVPPLHLTRPLPPRHRYTLDRPPAEWAYSSGFIDEEMLRLALWPAAADAQVLMCGPPPMLKFACVPNLLKMGYSEEQLISF